MRMMNRILLLTALVTAMAAKIAATPGAVGYVSSGAVPNDAKVLLVLK